MQRVRCRRPVSILLGRFRQLAPLVRETWQGAVVRLPVFEILEARGVQVILVNSPSSCIAPPQTASCTPTPAPTRTTVNTAGRDAASAECRRDLHHGLLGPEIRTQVFQAGIVKNRDNCLAAARTLQELARRSHVRPR